jgi:hypothetical protein
LELTSGEMGNLWEHMLLVGAKKRNVRANIRPKKAAVPFSNGSLNELLLNAPFNNGSKHKIIVKNSV